MLFICKLSFLNLSTCKSYQISQTVVNLRIVVFNLSVCKFYQISQNLVCLQIIVLNLFAWQTLSSFVKFCLSANCRFQFISPANFIKFRKILFICELLFSIYQPGKFYQISQNLVYLRIAVFNLSARQILSNLAKYCLSANCRFLIYQPGKFY